MNQSVKNRAAAIRHYLDYSDHATADPASIYRYSITRGAVGSRQVVD